MQVVLAMFRPNGERRSFSIVRDMTIVGRREDCDLRIPLGEVSRKHCRIIKDGDAVRVEDLGSSNGTFHNGTRIQEAVLAPGDNVRVGPVTFVIQIDGVPPDEALQPSAEAAGAQPREIASLEPIEASEADAASIPIPSESSGHQSAPIEFVLEGSQPDVATADVIRPQGTPATAAASSAAIPLSDDESIAGPDA
jgi:pSer/pThr/pTyr-binding forkhead associated (FHA) protein